LIPAERTSAAAGIIILPIPVIAMFSAALGLGDGIAFQPSSDARPVGAPFGLLL
jgi:hypothetical protein